jgi:hypothetical protein
MVKHGTVGEPTRGDERLERLWCRSGGMSTRCRPLQVVDRGKEAADPMIARLGGGRNDNPHRLDPNRQCCMYLPDFIAQRGEQITILIAKNCQVLGFELAT